MKKHMYRRLNIGLILVFQYTYIVNSTSHFFMWLTKLHKRNNNNNDNINNNNNKVNYNHENDPRIL